MSIEVQTEQLARDPRRWQLPLVTTVSAFWESLFLLKGSNLLDEGWALYTGMQLGMGRRLYDEIFWVFPPGHALPAWIGHVLDPQGVLVPRLIYAGFAVLLCATLYELGRRLSPPVYAFLGALLLAVAAPRSHMMHLIYGYRYMALAVLVLLAFSRRLERGDCRYMFLAGMIGGVCLFVRVTPALAVSCGIAVGVLACSRSWRIWLRDWMLYAAGLLLIIAPALVWFAFSVGLDRLWLDVIVRPMAMLQPLPVPPLSWPEAWSRDSITEAWRPLALRIFLVMYIVYAVSLVSLWIRALLAKRPFEHVLLLAVVVCGGVFYLRAFGRADEAHMDSTLPLICLLLAHGLGVAVERLRFWARRGMEAVVEVPRAASQVPSHRLAALVCAVFFAAWVFLTGSDLYLQPHRFRRLGLPQKVTASVELIEHHTQPGQIVLDLSAAPMFHALSGRPGPGHADIIMEGTFIDAAEELRFIAILENQPPAAVLWPVKDFDDMPSRALTAVAPRLAAWVESRYRPIARSAKFTLGLPRSEGRAPTPSTDTPRSHPTKDRASTPANVPSQPK